MIYNSPFPSSVKAMETSIEKSKPFIKQWNLSTFDGCNPFNIKEYEKKWPLTPKSYFKKTSIQKPITIKCCFYSHFSLWHKAIQKNKIVIVLEHDFYCTQAIDENILNGDYDFLDMGLCDSILKEFFIKSRIRNHQSQGYGRHHLPLYCHYYHKAPMFASLACYAITPHGAQKAIRNAQKDGWESADDFFNEKLGNCQYIAPSYVERAIEDPHTTSGSSKNKSQKIGKKYIAKIPRYMGNIKSCLLNVPKEHLTRKERFIRFLHLFFLRYTYVSLRFFYKFFDHSITQTFKRLSKN